MARVAEEHGARCRRVTPDSRTPCETSRQGVGLNGSQGRHIGNSQRDGVACSTSVLVVHLCPHCSFIFNWLELLHAILAPRSRLFTRNAVSRLLGGILGRRASADRSTTSNQRGRCRVATQDGGAGQSESRREAPPREVLSESGLRDRRSGSREGRAEPGRGADHRCGPAVLQHLERYGHLVLERPFLPTASKSRRDIARKSLRPLWGSGREVAPQAVGGVGAE